METDSPSQKRPHSPVSDTETNAGERTKPRLEEQPPTKPLILDGEIRDRSPLRAAASDNVSSSDSPGKSQASNASVIVPLATPPAAKTAPPLSPTRSLDRRPLSTRYREYCSTAPEYTAQEAEELVQSLLEVEHQLASPTRYENEVEILLQQDYDHLKLDQNIAASACEGFNHNDPQLVPLLLTLKEAEEALTTFEAVYPEVVLAATELFGDSEPVSPNVSDNSLSKTETPLSVVTTESSPVISYENPSASLEIPDGQPRGPNIEISPLSLPCEEPADPSVLTNIAEHLKTRRQSRHKSKGPSPDVLASCVRTRTTPALPGGRKNQSQTQHQPLPDSPYTQLVTDSGYLVTNPPPDTPCTRPKRPDTGAVGAVSPSPSSASHP